MASFLLSKYNTFLQKYPITGTSLSAGGCYTIGDWLAQKIEMKLGNRKEIDYHRIAVFSVFGTFVAGPIYFTWFNKLHEMPKILERVVKWNQRRLVGNELLKYYQQHAITGKLGDMSMKKFMPQQTKRLENAIVEKTTVLVSKVLADQLIFSSLYPLVFIPGTHILLQNTTKEDWNYLKQNKQLNYPKIINSWHEGVQGVKDKWFRIYTSDWQVWPTVQMINFAFFAPHLQPVVTNIGNVGWNAYLSYVSREGH